MQTAHVPTLDDRALYLAGHRMLKGDARVWLRGVRRINQAIIRLFVGRHDKQGLTWFVDVRDTDFQRAIIGDPARSAFILASCRAAVTAKPMRGDIYLAQINQEGQPK